MKVWLHDESDEHPTATHDSTHEYIDVKELQRVGVLGFVGQSMQQVDAIAEERGYVARDEVRSPLPQDRCCWPALMLQLVH